MLYSADFIYTFYGAAVVSHSLIGGCLRARPLPLAMPKSTSPTTPTTKAQPIHTTINNGIGII